MFGLPWVTWVRFFVWLAVGGVIYLFYGSRHSVLRQEAKALAAKSDS
jgi:APA family basic amino acid/polyamine antiporter